MAHAIERPTEAVDGVKFSFMNTEDVLKHSVVQITKERLVDDLGRAVPGGPYDPSLGPLEENASCKTCGQHSYYCPGHFGHIKFAQPIYNPLTFPIFRKILRLTCLHCYHFKTNREEVDKCVAQLKLISKGDVMGAKALNSDSQDDRPKKRGGSQKSCSTEASDTLCHQEWTSSQFAEAKSIFDDFMKGPQKNMKHRGDSKCKRCQEKNPKIKQSMFGWLQLAGKVIRHPSVNEASTSGEAATTDVAEGYASTVTHLSGESGDEAETHPTDGIQDTGFDKHRVQREQVIKPTIKENNFSTNSLLPSEAKSILEYLWKNEAPLCSVIGDIQQKGSGRKMGPSVFFLEVLLVPPIKFRPVAKRQSDSVLEHPHTALLAKILQSNIQLQESCDNETDYIERNWMDLQKSVNILFDSKYAGVRQKDAPSGICQLLEKKEGIFRQKMMGKRVNYSCRSVISPDPYLAVNEIGIPPYFALRLTYPERVTSWNVGKMRQAIVNGPDVHPGATHYVDKLSTVKFRVDNKQMALMERRCVSKKLPSSRGALLGPERGCDDEFEGKVVYRHLQDGDVVLVNRQPTLHKPSIMAHVVRVLKGEKTIRMHYANCSTYNADFDGDEMNVHFPQDEVSRAEAHNIVNANNQYIRPSSGEPIRSLIQDHIVSAVLLTKQDTFLTRDEFNQLLYSSGVLTAKSICFEKIGKVHISGTEDDMQPPLPAIWKPEPLWTGKQVISAVLSHITRGQAPFTIEKSGKIAHDFFKCRSNRDKPNSKNDANRSKLRGRKDNDTEKMVGSNKLNEKKKSDKEPGEDKLLIYKSELVRGVIDKAQFADYGLVHTVHELYGSTTAGTLLSVLSRLFTVFLQMHGFTCGVDDLLIIGANDEERKIQLESCEAIGEKVHREFIKVPESVQMDPMELQSDIEKTIRRDGEPAMTFLDRKMTSGLNEKTSSGALSVLLSDGILKPSGKNCISLMTTSGAKGSKVNFQQISSHLGQQELEGKRVPRMVSGKTLPCFHPWEWTSRAGGFIIDRFLTGLRPQEYYFHCMAGREGLVDTAVKTSRSGYLQRCLIKNLECLKVNYDYTVRDADGSIVQFQYGEDGVDVHQTSFMGKFDALAANQELIYKKSGQERGNRTWNLQLGTSNSYITKLPATLEANAEKYIVALPLKERASSNLVKQDDLLKLLKLKFMLSLAQPGEPVGVLAAQSVGEPSTQMTLNTFHLAGRGEMNVTLGIPRLQEILMAAATDIKTPVMTCPLHKDKTEEDAIQLADKLKKITVADIIEHMEVSVMPYVVEMDQPCRIYKLKMKLYKSEHYPKYTDITIEDWENTLDGVFMRVLEDAIQEHLVLLCKISGIRDFAGQSQSKESDVITEGTPGEESDRRYHDNEDDDGDDGDKADDLGSDAQKQKLQDTDEMDYGDSEDENDKAGSLAGFEGESDSGEDDINNQIEKGDPSDGEVIESPNPGENTEHELVSEKRKSKKKKRKLRSRLVVKETDRSFFVEANGFNFEAHFRFTKEPHILLAQIVEHTAKKVYIQSYGEIDKCRVTNCKENQVIYYGKDLKKRENIPNEEKEKMPALSTTGVDFKSLWQMQDVLDVRYLYSNSVDAMLKTYGVEAARETIIREIMHVFGSYGISVNIRHLTLIADYMTHNGGYRPMSRHGGISESISPLSKMSFETASKFIIEAAYNGERDDLETPSARICLGLPVKLGTGSFDLLQKVEV